MSYANLRLTKILQEVGRKKRKIVAKAKIMVQNGTRYLVSENFTETPKSRVVVG